MTCFTSLNHSDLHARLRNPINHHVVHFDRQRLVGLAYCIRAGKLSESFVTGSGILDGLWNSPQLCASILRIWYVVVEVMDRIRDPQSVVRLDQSQRKAWYGIQAALGSHLLRPLSKDLASLQERLQDIGRFEV